jgi:hypothetical protein
MVEFWMFGPCSATQIRCQSGDAVTPKKQTKSPVPVWRCNGQATVLREGVLVHLDVPPMPREEERVTVSL